MMHRKTLVTLAVFALAIVGAGILWFKPQSGHSPAHLPAHALVLPSSLELPNVSLLDDYGRPFTRDWFVGKSTLVFFGFTNCPDICPATLQILASARKQLIASNPQQSAIHILLVSVDPQRDTPNQLHQYIGHFGDGITAISGPLDELQKLAERFGIFFAREPGDSEHYNVSHSAHVLYVNQQGRYKAVFSAPHKAEYFVIDLPALFELAN